MLNNPTLIKVLEDNNKIDSFNKTIKGFGSNHKDLYELLNSLDETQSKEFSNIIDSTNGLGSAPSLSNDEEIDLSVYISNLPYPEGGVELKLYGTNKSGVGKGEYYAAFKIKGVENFESNTYDLKYDGQKIEVKQINKSLDPSDPALKGRLTNMDSFLKLGVIMGSLRGLKLKDKGGSWENFQLERPDLKKILDEFYDPLNKNLDKILTGEIPSSSTKSKRESNKDRMKLISRLFLVLNKYHDDEDVINYPELKDNYDFKRLWDHPYVISYREGLRQIVTDMNSVWKNNLDGTLKDIYVLLFVDETKKVFYGPGAVIFPSRSKNNQGISSNNTNVSRGGVRFFKNPSLTESFVNRFQTLAGIKKRP